MKNNLKKASKTFTLVLNEQEVRLSTLFTSNFPVINKDIGDVFARMKGDEYKNLNDALVDYLLKKKYKHPALKKATLNQQNLQNIYLLLFNLLITCYQQTELHKDSLLASLDVAIKNFDIKFEKIGANDMKKGVFVKFYKELLSPKMVTQLKEKVIMIIKTHVQPHPNLKDFINEHPNSKRLDEYVKKCIEISWRMHVVNVTQKQNPDFKFYPDNPFSLVDKRFDKEHQCILNNNVQKTTFTDLSNSEDSSSDSEDEVSLQRLIKKNKGKNNFQQKMDTSKCRIKQCTWPSIYHHQNTIHLKNAGKIEVLLKAPAPV